MQVDRSYSSAESLSLQKGNIPKRSGIWLKNAGLFLIPKQNFTNSSDIDWSKTIADIDRQLYTKYDLDEAEIAFIESHVKEMA